MVYSNKAVSWSHETTRNGDGRHLFLEVFGDGALSPELIAEVDRHCRYVRIEQDQILVSTEERVDKVFFLLAGEFRLSVHTRAGKLVAFRNAYPGAILCEAAFAREGDFPYTVEAAKTSTVACLGGAAFLNLMRSDASFLRSVLRKLLERQALLIEQVVELSTLSMHARLYKELLRLCRNKSNPDGSTTIGPVPTHSELARRIGTRREAVSREMSHLQHLGILVRREGNIFSVPSVSRLIELQNMVEH